jgi:light-regulated signal transduction histidine kinase (bacteriophytochrome)
MPEDKIVNLIPGSPEWKENALVLLAQLSHSLRNPFSTIQSYLNILEMEEYTYSPEELKDITLILKETVEKSIKTIDEKMAVIRGSLNAGE